MGRIVPSTREERTQAVLSILIGCVMIAVLGGLPRVLPGWAFWLLAGASLLVFVLWVRLRLFKRRSGE